MTGSFSRLNPGQRAAVEHAEPRALLVVAGAGSGKTNTLAHRVAHLILGGADPRRILLLTFTRRAAAEMTRRAHRIVAQAAATAVESAESGDTAHMALHARLPWSGTFHAVAARLLRLHAEGLGLAPEFTVLDRSDSADLMDLLRVDLELAKTAHRFPKKGTCLAIYSRTVNARCSLDEALAAAFPWCRAWEEELRSLFLAYVVAKQERGVLDFDDLLLYWSHLMAEEALSSEVRERFDHVLVDEYQDTNALQAEILLGLKPDGCGLTVVGDDAQSIYAFRSATVRNILDFPVKFATAARVVLLEQNYRSTQPILAACNAVIGLSKERFTKDLTSTRSSRQKPVLVSAEDETAQAEYVAERVLQQREAGIPLARQAVLFRAAHHSDLLEVELGRRDVPFVKYGGLRFLEAAHVKDLLCILRWAENPRDAVAGFRVVQLLPGVGPRTAEGALAHLRQRGFDFGELEGFRPPEAAADDWPSLCALLAGLRDPQTAWPGQLGAARRWYEPQLARLYDSANVRAGDLDQLEQLSASYPTCERFLTELTLDPPQAAGDEAANPHLDEDHLILTTIHSAKGQEWDAVFVLNVVDGCIPSDLSTARPEEIEEERRLLYVAMTRARDALYLVHPHQFSVRQQRRNGDAHLYAPRSRFLPESVLPCFEREMHAPPRAADPRTDEGARPVRVDVAARMRDMWS